MAKKDATRDFVIGENNGVIAVCVVNPEILEQDDEYKRGRAFLFYVGNARVNCPASEINAGTTDKPLRPFCGKRPEFDRLIKGRNRRGDLPEKVVINGKEVLTETLHIGCYVPFSFGIGHDSDVKGFWEGSSQFRGDYDSFLEVLARYDEIRKTFGYRIKKFFGFAPKLHLAQ